MRDGSVSRLANGPGWLTKVRGPYGERDGESILAVEELTGSIV